MEKKKNAAVHLGGLVMLGLLRAALAADPPADSPPPQAPAAASVPIDVEVFDGVQIRRGPGANLYPAAEVSDGREGWVVLDMMIDPKGQPYEVMVVGSSGNPAFEKAALRGVKQVSFEPARRGSTPIDSSFMFKMKFAISGLANGASPDFVSAYRRLNKALEAGDKARADVELGALKPQNLYEDAFANYSRFYYHRRWGTPAEQVADLAGAIAGERRPVYLPKDAFKTALYSMLRLQIQLRDYGGALATADILEPLASPDMRTEVQRVVDQLHTLQVSNEPLREAAMLGEQNNWHTELFRKTFSISVKSGAVSEIKLRCAQKYLIFKYEPDLQYSIGTKHDRCSIEVVGDPGTQFELIQ